MRIGRTIIDTDNMSAEDMDVIIKALRAIRARKLQAEELNNRMNTLLTEAKENNFIFINDYTGQVLPQEYIKVIDEQ
jgi:hypothetical protein